MYEIKFTPLMIELKVKSIIIGGGKPESLSLFYGNPHPRASIGLSVLTVI